MTIQAVLTEVRNDGMQKWERVKVPKHDQSRYIWIQAFQSKPGAKVGDTGTLQFQKGTGGAIGGHWATWQVMTITPGW